ncbi:sodium-dependent transporter [Pelagerythrobacter rhizovicinus]|uniref:Transporter n=1 Tax=Pelagerythrobacter rhizovicinus TaxID=2268576 RepID=A0A4Q2KQ57_9SPHN|nr:sodium-dependent transporter [Pelagerythrobacter rhizovicinus]RXZ66540.1 sodium-dependent transporter [Pelagerythrobacter rhizovicinus]
MTTSSEIQPQFRWSSRLALIFAASGFSVGLGNIWRFPYLTGENGGAAFILVYLACAFGIGLPLVMAELMLGRRGKRGVVGSLQAVAAKSGASERWGWIGKLALLATFAILSYYVVIAGWTLDYMVRATTGTFAGIGRQDSTAVFQSLMDSPWRMIVWGAITIGVTGLAVGRGLQGGIEKVTGILMPLFFVGLVLFAGYALLVGDAASAMRFLFVPDFSKIDGAVIAMAVGQAFFSVGVGFGTMVSFGSYLEEDVSIGSTAAIIVAADTAVALVAGLTIFPFVFLYGLEVTSGPGLVFETLPVAFGAMPAGELVGLAFFFLLFIAAITSCVGLLEPLAKRVRAVLGMRLPAATAMLGLLVFVASLGTVLSFNEWAGVYPLSVFAPFAESTIYVVQDYIAVNVLLPVGSLLTAIFTGWFANRRFWAEELSIGGPIAKAFWLPAMRYVIPIAIATLLIWAQLG